MTTGQQITALKAEIAADPLALGYKNPDDSWKDNATLLSLLNAESPSDTKTVDKVPTSEVLIWLAANSKLDVLKSRSTDVGKNAAIRSVAQAALTLVTSANTPTLDLGRPENIGMIDAMVADGVLDAAEKTSLLALKSVKISRAEAVLGGAATDELINEARATI